jgi:hypothetical protein
VEAVAWALPVVLTIAFAFEYGISIPLWDSWMWVDQLRGFTVRQLDLLDILTLVHNEHPYGFPTLLFLKLGGIWDYSLKPFTVMSCLAMAGIALVLARYSVRFAGRSAALVLIVSLLAMSLRQVDNQIIAFQIGFPLTVLFGLGATCMAAELRRDMPIHIAVALISGMSLCLIAAGFCSAASLAVFPAVGFVLLTGGRSKSQWLAAGVAVVICILWLHSYLPTLRGADLTQGSKYIEKAMGLLLLAGSPFTESRTAGFALGGAVLLLFVSTSIDFWRRSRAEQILIGIGIMSFGLLATVAAGRGLMGGINPPRYATFGVPLAAVTIALTVGRVQGKYRLRVTYFFLVGSLIASIVGAASAYPIAVATQGQEIANTEVMLNHRTRRDPEIATINVGSPQLMRDLIAFFETNRYNVFSDSPDLAFSRVPISEFQRAGNARYEKNDTGAFVMTGPNHIYTTTECPELSCVIRWELRGVISVHGNIGLIFKDGEGNVILNSPVPIEGISGGRAVATLAAPTGTQIVEAYIYSPTEADTVRFRSAILGVKIIN